MPIRNKYTFETVEAVRVGRLNSGINTTFIVYRIGSTLIDAGPANQWGPVKNFISEKPIQQLLLTHHHEDHSGNADRIAKFANIVPLAPELSQRKLKSGYKTPLLQKIIWGSPRPVATAIMPAEVFLEDGTKINPIHTPGHAKDLHCLYLPEKKWLFSGDLYISKSLRYFRSDENLEQLLESIRKVLKLDFDVLFCPHRGIVEEGRQALTAKLHNILALCEKAQTLQARGIETSQIVREILGPEDMMARMTCNNFSKRNMIEEALKVTKLAA
ncbi:MAG: MBL fold metallo-hydrolase [Sneathiella sp.]|nr:MBL fold metallo-hydrolase [Sneathiella sp.]